ncbi:MAG: lysoplasmalogenase family protein, partial [Pseudomonadota bacterium]
YTAGFWVSGTASLNDWGRSLFLTLAFTGLALRYLWPRLLPPWRGAVLSYTVIIGLMVASAFAGGMAGHLAMGFVVAAAAFAISDISVARDRLTAHDPRSRRWGLPLYYASQLLFAFSIAI